MVVVLCHGGKKALHGSLSRCWEKKTARVPEVELATLLPNPACARRKSSCSITVGHLAVTKLQPREVHGVCLEGEFYQQCGTFAGTSTTMENFPHRSLEKRNEHRSSCVTTHGIRRTAVWGAPGVRSVCPPSPQSK